MIEPPTVLALQENAKEFIHQDSALIASTATAKPKDNSFPSYAEVHLKSNAVVSFEDDSSGS